MNNGYIAISSVLVICAVIIIIGTTVALSSISEGQMSLAGIRSRQALDILEGCADEALLYINENNTITPTIDTPQGTCTLMVNSITGVNWSITLSTTVSGYTKTMDITVIRNSTMTITSWEEG